MKMADRRIAYRLTKVNSNMEVQLKYSCIIEPFLHANYYLNFFKLYFRSKLILLGIFLSVGLYAASTLLYNFSLH